VVIDMIEEACLKDRLFADALLAGVGDCGVADLSGGGAVGAASNVAMIASGARMSE